MTAPSPKGRRVVLLGGSSEIGLAIVCELQHRAPREVMLVGRNGEALAAAASRLTQTGCPRVLTTELDAVERGRHGQALEQAFRELGGADIVVLALGALGERGGLPSDIGAAGDLLEVNVLGAGSLMMHAARLLRDGGGGTIVVLSSVAAERARKSNAVYGASKAGLDALAQGLGDALRGEGVRDRRASTRVCAHEDDPGPQAGATRQHARGCRAGARRRARPWRSHRVGPARDALGGARDPPPSTRGPSQGQPMSARRSPTYEPVSTAELAELSELRARRRAARRRVRLARLDLALGIGAGLALIIFTPGLAIAGLIAILAVVLCVASLIGGRILHCRRAGRTARRSRRALEALAGEPPSHRAPAAPRVRRARPHCHDVCGERLAPRRARRAGQQTMSRCGRANIGAHPRRAGPPTGAAKAVSQAGETAPS